MIFKLVLVAVLFASCTNKKSSTEELTDALIKSRAVDSTVEDYFNQILQIGYKNPSEIRTLITSYESSKDELTRFKLSIPLTMLSVNVRLNDAAGATGVELSAEEKEVIKKAQAELMRISVELSEFEKTFTIDDFKEIAGSVENSPLIYTQSLLSVAKRCDEEEYKKLLALDKKKYSNSKIVSALLGLTLVHHNENVQTYLDNYLKLVDRKTHPRKEFFKGILIYMKNKKNQPRDAAWNEQTTKRSIETLSKNGINNHDQILFQSIQASPYCMGKMNARVVHFANHYGTSRRMEAFHLAVGTWLSKNTGDTAFVEKKKSPLYKELDYKIEKELREQGTEYRDSWGRGFSVKVNNDGFQVVSSGKDRRLETADDLFYPEKK